MQRDQRLWAKGLALFGATPFIAAVLAQLAGLANDHTTTLSLTYGAIIISFLSGIHWGLYLTHEKARRINLLITSNILAVLAWVTLWLWTPGMQYLVQLACFISLLMIDRRLLADGVIERWFYQLRQQISLLVMVCLLLMVWWSR